MILILGSFGQEIGSEVNIFTPDVLTKFGFPRLYLYIPCLVRIMCMENDCYQRMHAHSIISVALIRRNIRRNLQQFGPTFLKWLFADKILRITSCLL